MNRIVARLVIILLLSVPLSGYSQSTKIDPKHEKNVRDMVRFLQYMLNTLGDEKTPAQDKEILITESYAKVFRDAKVQIEDDLAEKRNVITNKDVPAYLKDVDFFFTHVQFELTIEDIQAGGSGDKLFYKVKVARNLKGKTVEGKAVNATIPRFIEINYNAKAQDLKIVSMYTNVIDEKESLVQWWNGLSYEWQAIFRREANLTDSVDLEGIRTITAIDSLNLARNKYIQNIEPLAALVGLRYLNLSTTQVSDLTPIRNLTELVTLDIARTAVADITPLRYAMKLGALNLRGTRVNDLSVLSNLEALQSLDVTGVPATDFTALTSLTQLKRLVVAHTRFSSFDILQSPELLELNAAKTSVTDLSPLSRLSKIESLTIDSTTFTLMTPLASLKNLKVLSLNGTAITSLEPLNGLTQLERIYCDNTSVKQEMATAFVSKHPDVLIIFDSRDLRGWWSSLPAGWRDVFRRGAKIGTNPTKEDLAKVTNLDSINLSNDISIQDLVPLSKLAKVRVLMAAKTSIDDLSPLQNASELKVLDVSHTRINDAAAFVRFSSLSELRADGTQLPRIDTLITMKSLKRLYLDQTPITNDQVKMFLQKSPGCLVVYKTGILQQWWTNLTDTWKGILQRTVSMSPAVSREDLHRLVETEKVSFSNEPVDDLTPLQEFVRLKILHFSGTSISKLDPLTRMRTLESLRVNDNPIRDLSPLIPLDGLQELDIANTAIEDLEVLHNFQQLTRLNCAGTKMKRLDILERMKELKYLDCSNTDIRQLDPVANLSLTELKCYNTRVTDKEVSDFKKANPDCKVTYYR